MAKEVEKNGHKPTSAPVTSAEASATPAEDGGGRIRLGKRRSTWKPGGRPISGYLFGISGIRTEDLGVAETLIIQVDRTTDAYDWDRETREAKPARDTKPKEEVAVFLTAGLESLRAYANDPDFVRHVYIPKGTSVKLKGGKKFWQYVSDDPDATDTLTVSTKKWKRTENTIVEKVMEKGAPEDAGDTVPGSAARREERNEGDFDAAPF